MKKLKVGDKVLVCKPKGRVLRPNWIPEMNKCVGKILTIDRFTPQGYVMFKKCSWCFNSRWLKPIKSTNKLTKKSMNPNCKFCKEVATQVLGSPSGLQKVYVCDKHYKIYHAKKDLFRKDLASLDAKVTETLAHKTPKQTKTIVEIDVKKEGSSIVLLLKADAELEKFWKNIATQKYGTDNVQQSTKWFGADGVGLMFYKTDAETEAKIIQTLNGALATHANSHRVNTNFGSGLMKDGMVNVGLLRAVGLTEGVSLQTHDLLGYEEIKLYAEVLGVVMKELYQNYLKELQFKASIKFEY